MTLFATGFAVAMAALSGGKGHAHRERELAVELARNIRGVKAVHAKGLVSWAVEHLQERPVSPRS
jgi:hypothetical protein